MPLAQDHRVISKAVRPTKQYLGYLRKLQTTENPVLMGDFQAPKHFLEEQTIANISFVKFWKCVENHFLIRMLAMPAGKGALLDTNQEKLLSFISQSAMVL